MKRYSCIFALLFLYFSQHGKLNAQSLAINTSGSIADPSAILDVTSDLKGILIPRLTDAEMRAIGLPAKGLLVINTTDSSIYMKRDTGWVKTSFGKADNYWNYNNGHIHTFNSGNVGIGLSNPIHAGLETSITVGAAAAMFGVGKFGVTIQADNPEVGLNYYYNGGPYTMKAGYAANMGMYPSDGTVYIGNFQNNFTTSDFSPLLPANGTYKNRLLIYRNGTTLMGDDTTSFDKKFIYFAQKGALRAGVFYGSSSPVGQYSVALGDACRAEGHASFAAGLLSRATGPYSIALGFSNASGLAAIALGGSISSGVGAVAIGTSSTASADFSTAIGTRASTNGHIYSVCIGASGVVPTNPSVANEYDHEFMVYAERYRFWTSSSGTSVYMNPGGNAWLSTCDKTRKENFEPVNGETVLQKLSAIPLSSWNYKNQDSKNFRHYGIMAQDFFDAFGNDSYGKIGNDTAINPIDMLGIAYSGLQALEKRTQKIKSQEILIENLQYQNDELKLRLNKLEKMIGLLTKNN